MFKKSPFILAFIFSVFLASCSSLSQSGGFLTGGHSDQSINDAVLLAFSNDPSLVDAPIQVETHNGVVRLSGHVKLIRQTDTAAEIASKIDGVKMVQNDLVIRK